MAQGNMGCNWERRKVGARSKGDPDGAGTHRAVGHCQAWGPSCLSLSKSEAAAEAGRMVPWTPGSLPGKQCTVPSLLAMVMSQSTACTQALGGASRPCLCSPRGTQAADLRGD